MTKTLDTLKHFLVVARFLVIQAIQRNIVSLKRSWLISPTTQPDAWKTIAARTYLYPSRIFRPKHVEDTERIPLIVMVHGGGFIMNNPSADDPLARFLADRCKVLVVNIDYRKAPLNMFPAGYEDVVGSILTLLDDKDLPIDKSKVFLCGSSAGGNLVLGAAQDPRLRNKLQGIVALTPVVNFIPTAREQMETRPDPTIPDFLGDMWDGALEVYAGTTDHSALRDTRLSPTFFKDRQDLPKHIFMIGCEHDMLCHEAKLMAEKLIEAEKRQTSSVERHPNVVWMLVQGQTHGFDHFPQKPAAKEAKRLKDRELLYENIAQWFIDTCAKP